MRLSSGCVKPLTVDEFVKYLDKVFKSGNGYRACCPAHSGKDANLAIWTRDDSTIGIKCYSHGCDRKDVLEAVGLTLADILPNRTPEEARRHKVHTNDRRTKKALTIELLVLLQWLDAFYREVFPEQDGDDARVRLAWQRVLNACRHYLRVE